MIAPRLGHVASGFGNMVVPMTPEQGVNAASVARRGVHATIRNYGIDWCRVNHFPHDVPRRQCRVKCCSTKPDEITRQ
jgi:hypothetical protein